MSDDQTEIEKIKGHIAFNRLTIDIQSNLLGDADICNRLRRETLDFHEQLYQSLYRLEHGLTIEQLEEPDEYALFLLRYGHELGGQS